MILVVTGLGRCGTSLAMQMLSLGGKDLGDHPRCIWPFFEDPRATQAENWDWIREFDGKAVKILVPNQFTPPAGLDYKFVWLDRDRKEQAKSWNQYNRERMKQSKVPHHSVVQKELKKHRAEALDALEGLGPVTRMRFEDLIQNPEFAARKLADLADIRYDSKMIHSVVPRRVNCSKVMLEPTLVKVGPPKIETSQNP